MNIDAWQPLAFLSKLTIDVSSSTFSLTRYHRNKQNHFPFSFKPGQIPHYKPVAALHLPFIQLISLWIPSLSLRLRLPQPDTQRPFAALPLTYLFSRFGDDNTVCSFPLLFHLLGNIFVRGQAFASWPLITTRNSACNLFLRCGPSSTCPLSDESRAYFCPLSNCFRDGLLCM
jgi:hypothetical protein